MSSKSLSDETQGVKEARERICGMIVPKEAIRSSNGMVRRAGGKLAERSSRIGSRASRR